MFVCVTAVLCLPLYLETRVWVLVQISYNQISISRSCWRSCFGDSFRSWEATRIFCRRAAHNFHFQILSTFIVKTGLLYGFSRSFISFWNLNRHIPSLKWLAIRVYTLICCCRLNPSSACLLMCLLHWFFTYCTYIVFVIKPLVRPCACGNSKPKQSNSCLDSGSWRRQRELASYRLVSASWHPSCLLATPHPLRFPDWNVQCACKATRVVCLSCELCTVVVTHTSIRCNCKNVVDRVSSQIFLPLAGESNKSQHASSRALRNVVGISWRNFFLPSTLAGRFSRRLLRSLPSFVTPLLDFFTMLWSSFATPNIKRHWTRTTPCGCNPFFSCTPPAANISKVWWQSLQVSRKWVWLLYDVCLLTSLSCLASLLRSVRWRPQWL